MGGPPPDIHCTRGVPHVTQPAPLLQNLRTPPTPTGGGGGGTDRSVHTYSVHSLGRYIHIGKVVKQSWVYAHNNANNTPLLVFNILIDIHHNREVENVKQIRNTGFTHIV